MHSECWDKSGKSNADAIIIDDDSDCDEDTAQPQQKKSRKLGDV